MPVSDVAICNAALVRLGQSRLVALSDDSDQARLCTDVYPLVRDTVLREHAWQCLVARKMLPRLEAAPAFGFAYQYELPSDCSRVLETDNAAFPWAREGHLLLSDAVTVGIRYLKQATEEAYDDALLGYLSKSLEAELAWAIQGHQEHAVALYAQAQAALAAAQRADGMEGTADAPRACLQALRHLGAQGQPGKVDLATAVRLLRESYTLTRQALLREGQWNFALRRVSLRPIGTGDGTELVVNGTFPATITSWTNRSTGTGSIAWSAGAMQLVSGLSGVGAAEQGVPTTAAIEYVLTFTVATTPLTVRLGTVAQGQDLFADTIYAVGVHTIYFQAASATTYLGFRQPGPSLTTLLDTVSVQISTATAPVSGFDRQFEIPRAIGGTVAYLRALEIDATDAMWRIEGQRLLTDETAVVLGYIGDIEDEEEFDPLFTQALASRLAAEHGLAIIGTAAGAQALMQTARDATALGHREDIGTVFVRPNRSLTDIRLGRRTGRGHL